MAARTSARKKLATKGRSKRGSGKYWVASVTSDSTHPPEGLYQRCRRYRARSLLKRVSPKGPVSRLRMLIYFINRGGRGLSAPRRAELEKAKDLLSRRIKRDREKRDA